MRMGAMGAPGGFGSAGHLGGAAGRAPYLGNVATRVDLPNQLGTTTPYANIKRGHYARDNITSLQLVIPNFYVKASAATGEIATGADATVAASVEYPIGTRTQVLFSTSTTGTITSGSFLISDAVSVTIPRDELFYVYIFWNCSAGLPYRAYSANKPGVFGTDRYEYSTGVLADKTMSGTITQTSPTATNTFGCCAILAQTRRPSIMILGDSRTLGTQDVNDSSGDLGTVARSIGPTLPYANYGISSLSAAGWNNSHANQLLLKQYFTHVINTMSGNDIYGGASAATTRTRLETMNANFTGMPLYVSTCEAETTSTDSWTTTANQTVIGAATSNVQRLAFNALVRAGSIAGSVGYFEIADQVESARDSSLWNANGVTANWYTQDGIHESQTACLAIKNSGCINPALFV